MHFYKIKAPPTLTGAFSYVPVRLRTQVSCAKLCWDVHEVHTKSEKVVLQQN